MATAAATFAVGVPMFHVTAMFSPYGRSLWSRRSCEASVSAHCCAAVARMSDQVKGGAECAARSPSTWAKIADVLEIGWGVYDDKADARHW